MDFISCAINNVLVKADTNCYSEKDSKASFSAVGRVPWEIMFVGYTLISIPQPVMPHYYYTLVRLMVPRCGMPVHKVI